MEMGSRLRTHNPPSYKIDMNHTASLIDTGTWAGQHIKVSMFLEQYGKVTPLTRGQIEQTPAGPVPHGIHLYRCRCCSLDCDG